MRFDETLHSGTYYGTGKTSREVTGGCLTGLLTSIWSVEWFFCCDLTRFILIYMLGGHPWIRHLAGHEWHPQCPVGSQRNRRKRAILHSTGHNPAIWWSWSWPVHARSFHSLYILGPEIYYNLYTSYQLLSIHTFVSALWQVGSRARGFAVFMVFLVFCFVTLWTSIGPSIHKQYEVPVPVRYSHFFFSFALYPHC
jgi:hypothetical protein